MDVDVLDNYFSEEKAASDLGVTVNTLRNWAARREGPARTKVARRVYYRKEAMNQWLLTQEQNPEAANGQGARA